MNLNSGLSRLAGDVGALGAGAFLPLAFAPFHLVPLAVISPAILFWLWTGLSAQQAFRRGWWFGLGMFGVGVSWIQISVHQFGLPVLAFSVSVTALFIAFLALYPAVLGYLANRLFPASSDRVRFLLVLPALWTLIEWFRGWLLSGFPWLNLGYSQIDTPLSGFAPIVGVYGVSLATAFSTGVLGQVLYTRRVTYLALLVPLWGGGWALGQIPWSKAVSEPLKVALIQGNIQQHLKWLPSERQAILRRYLELSTPHWGVDLMVWPETAIPAFYHDVRPFITALTALAEKTGTEMLIGMAVRAPDGSAYYNSVVHLGNPPRFYHKRHLVPFGEYLPLKGLVGGVLDFLEIPMSDFSAGSPRQPLLEVSGHAVGVSICYEDAFGEEIINALPQAHLLVNVSNDSWFGDSIAPHQHLEIARMRALESGRYLLRSTNTGVSAIIDPQGKIIARSPQFKAHALAAEVHPYQGTTPYVYLGNSAVVLPLIVVLSWLFLRQFKMPSLPRTLDHIVSK